MLFRKTKKTVGKAKIILIGFSAVVVVLVLFQGLNALWFASSTECANPWENYASKSLIGSKQKEETIWHMIPYIELGACPGFTFSHLEPWPSVHYSETSNSLTLIPSTFSISNTTYLSTEYGIHRRLIMNCTTQQNPRFSVGFTSNPLLFFSYPVSSPFQQQQEEGVLLINNRRYLPERFYTDDDPSDRQIAMAASLSGDPHEFLVAQCDIPSMGTVTNVLIQVPNPPNHLKYEFVFIVSLTCCLFIFLRFSIFGIQSSSGDLKRDGNITNEHILPVASLLFPQMQKPNQCNKSIKMFLLLLLLPLLLPM
jgi:hypothetical protein